MHGKRQVGACISLTEHPLRGTVGRQEHVALGEFIMMQLGGWSCPQKMFEIAFAVDWQDQAGLL